MNKKISALIGVIVLALLIAGSAVTYNILANDASPGSVLGAAGSAEPETKQSKPATTQSVTSTAGRTQSKPTQAKSEPEEPEKTQSETSTAEKTQAGSQELQPTQSVTSTAEQTKADSPEPAPASSNTAKPVADDRIKAPDFTMTDWDGNNIKLSDIVAGGKPIVLNFWASWCPPCKNEMPEFDEVYLEYGEEVQFIMLDLVDGQQETIKNGKRYIEEQGYAFPVYFDDLREGAYAYGVRAIPSTLFIDSEGYVVTAYQGMIDKATLLKGINLIM